MDAYTSEGHETTDHTIEQATDDHYFIEEAQGKKASNKTFYCDEEGARP